MLARLRLVSDDALTIFGQSPGTRVALSALLPDSAAPLRNASSLFKPDRGKALRISGLP